MYLETRAWEQRVEEAVAFFQMEDLIALLHCVFNHILRDAGVGEGALISEESCTHPDTLISSEPRISLSLLLKRLQKIFRWIQVSTCLLVVAIVNYYNFIRPKMQVSRLCYRAY
jgi:hypothetical protein